ncbi:glycosyltransferase family 9 protein [Dyadobacter arcticus]|uniref:Glycosyltransferase family 9 (Heptosyltransferase) n=1 Tax=Dyadobacter arcticus TaxID=1078754 RepID=A0ABX0UH38_9BACT|nr:glycosyltransferase family 9 protein [Dyadobacter arcticus]NIJ52328.1 hypothetical protein [Dyadobacter arcticus]
MGNKTSVFTTFGGGFGDCWATASFFATEGKTKEVFLETVDPRILKIIAQFDTSIPQIIYTRQPADVAIMSPSDSTYFFSQRGYQPKFIVPWRTMFARPYLPTRVTWRQQQCRKRIVYHLSPSTFGPTSCQPGEAELLVEKLTYLKFEAIRLGDHMSLEENIKIAASSDFFIGIDSGVSHLCHSVGIPIVLIRNRLTSNYLKVTHAKKAYVEVESIPCFLNNFHKILGQIETYTELQMPCR